MVRFDRTTGKVLADKFSATGKEIFFENGREVSRREAQVIADLRRGVISKTDPRAIAFEQSRIAREGFERRKAEEEAARKAEAARVAARKAAQIDEAIAAEREEARKRDEARLQPEKGEEERRLRLARAEANRLRVKRGEIQLGGIFGPEAMKSEEEARQTTKPLVTGTVKETAGIPFSTGSIVTGRGKRGEILSGVLSKGVIHKLDEPAKGAKIRFISDTKEKERVIAEREVQRKKFLEEERRRDADIKARQTKKITIPTPSKPPKTFAEKAEDLFGKIGAKLTTETIIPGVAAPIVAKGIEAQAAQRQLKVQKEIALGETKEQKREIFEQRKKIDVTINDINAEIRNLNQKFKPEDKFIIRTQDPITLETTGRIVDRETAVRILREQKEGLQNIKTQSSISLTDISRYETEVKKIKTTEGVQPITLGPEAVKPSLISSAKKLPSQVLGIVGLPGTLVEEAPAKAVRIKAGIQAEAELLGGIDIQGTTTPKLSLEAKDFIGVTERTKQLESELMGKPGFKVGEELASGVAAGVDIGILVGIPGAALVTTGAFAGQLLLEPKGTISATGEFLRTPRGAVGLTLGLGVAGVSLAKRGKGIKAAKVAEIMEPSLVTDPITFRTATLPTEQPFAITPQAVKAKTLSAVDILVSGEKVGEATVVTKTVTISSPEVFIPQIEQPTTAIGIIDPIPLKGKGKISRGVSESTVALKIEGLEPTSFKVGGGGIFETAEFGFGAEIAATPEGFPLISFEKVGKVGAGFVKVKPTRPLTPEAISVIGEISGVTDIAEIAGVTKLDIPFGQEFISRSGKFVKGPEFGAAEIVGITERGTPFEGIGFGLETKVGRGPPRVSRVGKRVAEITTPAVTETALSPEVLGAIAERVEVARQPKVVTPDIISGGPAVTARGRGLLATAKPGVKQDLFTGQMPGTKPKAKVSDLGRIEVGTLGLVEGLQTKIGVVPTIKAITTVSALGSGSALGRLDRLDFGRKTTGRFAPPIQLGTTVPKGVEEDLMKTFSTGISLTRQRRGMQRMEDKGEETGRRFQRAISSISFGIVSGQGLEEELQTGQIQRRITKTGVKQDLDLFTQQMPGVIPPQIPPRIPAPPPTPTTTPFTTGFLLPPIPPGFGLEDERDMEKKIKDRFGVTPSFAAIQFGLIGKQAKKGDILTGLELRGVTKEFAEEFGLAGSRKTSKKKSKKNNFDNKFGGLF